MADSSELEHIGWVSARWTPDSYPASVHRHFFDDWAQWDEAEKVLAAHTTCRPVFAAPTSSYTPPPVDKLLAVVEAARELAQTHEAVVLPEGGPCPLCLALRPITAALEALE